MSIVRLLRVAGCTLEVDELDVLDGTPLLDIKPYTARFDRVDETRNGWQDGLDEKEVQARGRRMPPFLGMGYPLVPGYEAAGEIVEAPAGAQVKVGDRVFVPGATCFGEVRGLFGAAARHIVTPASRVTPIDSGLGAEGA
jgi:hypothetical protein